MGPEALRITWRRTTVDRAPPRLIATSTCSRPSSSSIDDRVTRATSAMNVSESAMAGSVRWYSRSANPSPAPYVGNTPSRTENTEMSRIAAANDGIAASTVTPTSTTLSGVRPAVSDPAMPAPRPTTMMSSAESTTRPKRGRQPGRDERRDVVAVLERASEVAVQRVAQPVQVLHEERVVEAVLRLDRRDRLRRGAAPLDEEVDRVARRDVERGEHQERRDEQRHHEAEQPPGDHRHRARDGESAPRRHYSVGRHDSSAQRGSTDSSAAPSRKTVASS